MQEAFMLPNTAISSSYTENQSTDVYTAIAAMWKDVLALETVEYDHDFFNLGGDSLRAMMVQVRVREVLGLEVPIDLFFEFRQLGALCEYIDQLSRQHTLDLSAIPVPQEQIIRPAALPLSAEQLHLWHLIRRNRIRLDVTNLPIVVRFSGPLNTTLLCRSVREVVRRHEALRTRIIDSAAGPTQTVDPTEAFAILHTDLSACADVTLAVNVTVENSVWQPFDVAGGPLFRANLIKVAEDEHILAMVIHHLIGDGWSAEILSSDISAIYNALLQGQPNPLPELQYQFIDHILQREQWLTSPAARQQQQFWEQHLVDAPPPPSMEKPSVGHGISEVRMPVHLPPALSHQLVRLAEQEAATLFMVLLTAFKIAFSRLTQVHDICIYSATAGRNDSRLERLIGTFARPLVVRTLLAKGIPFRSALALVKQACMDTYARQDVSPLSASMLKQRNGIPVSLVSFQLHNQIKRHWNLSGTTATDISTSPPLGEVSPLGQIVLELEYTEEGLHGPLVYSAAQVSKKDIDRFIDQFEIILRQVAADIDSVAV
jgi:acyl carrier protein